MCLEKEFFPVLVSNDPFESTFSDTDKPKAESNGKIWYIVKSLAKAGKNITVICRRGIEKGGKVEY